MKNIRKILALALAVLGVIIALAPHQLFPICSKLRPDGTPMSCFYTAKLVLPLGIVLAVFGAFAFWKNKKSVYYLSSVVAIVVGFVGYALPNRIIPIGSMKTMGWQIGYCMKETMICNATIKPALNIIMPLVLLLGIGLIIMNMLSRSE